MPFFDYTTPFAPLQAPEPRPDPISNALDSILQRQAQERNLEAQRLHLQQQHQNALDLERKRQEGDIALEAAKAKTAAKLRDSTEEASNVLAASKEISKSVLTGKFTPAVGQAIAAAHNLTFEEITDAMQGQAVPAPAPSPAASPAVSLVASPVPSAAVPPSEGFSVSETQEPQAGQNPLEPRPQPIVWPDMPGAVTMPQPSASASRGPAQDALAMLQRQPTMEATLEPLGKTPSPSEPEVKAPPSKRFRLVGAEKKYPPIDFGALEKQRADTRAANVAAVTAYKKSIASSPDMSPQMKKIRMSAADAVLAESPDIDINDLPKQINATINQDLQLAANEGKLGVLREGIRQSGERGEITAEGQANRNIESWGRAENNKKLMEDMVNARGMEATLRTIQKNPGNATAIQKSQIEFELARLMNGPGVLTKQDVLAAGGKWGLGDQLWNWYNGQGLGVITPEKLASIQTLFNTFKERSREEALRNLTSFRDLFLGDVDTPTMKKVPSVYNNFYRHMLGVYRISDEEVLDRLGVAPKASPGRQPKTPPMGQSAAASVASPVPSGAPGAAAPGTSKARSVVEQLKAKYSGAR